MAHGGRWELHEVPGSVQQLHDWSAELLAGPGRTSRHVRANRPRDRAVVLGSSQPGSSLDAAACAAHGVGAARRRSGGGAVLVQPGSLLWVDVLVPAGDDLWSEDVGQASWWLGEAWAGALAAAGTAGARVWKGPMQRRPWSDLVCFAGLGPGEVTLATGEKVVGLSQRRTRAGALFQCACLLDWRPEALVRLLALAEEERRRAAEELQGVAAACRSDAPALLGHFMDALSGY